MRVGHIFYVLGWGGLCLAVAMLLPLCMSLFEDKALYAQFFAIGFLITGFISGIFILGGYSKDRPAVENNDLILTIVLFWILLPFPAAIPLYAEGQITSFAAAYIEAVSALTTTGASVIGYPEFAAPSILLWRAILAWIGGLWILLFAFTVIAPLAIGGVSLSALPLLQYDAADDLVRRIRRPLRILVPLYGGLSVLTIVLVFWGGSGFFEAITLGLSAISTTGFSINSAALPDFLSLFSQFGIVFGCICGALSVPVLIGLQKQWVFINEELRVFTSIVLIFGLIGFGLFGGTIMAHIAQSISLFSTSAFMFLPHENLAGWPLIWVLLPCFIGGMSLSTTGGMKVSRLIILIKDILRGLSYLAYPSRVHGIKLNDRRLTEIDNASIRVYLSILILLIAGGLLIYGMLGHDLITSWSLIMAMITNSGAILFMSATYNLFAELPLFSQFIAALFMIIGRLELVIFFTLLNKDFWHKGPLRGAL